MRTNATRKNAMRCGLAIAAAAALFTTSAHAQSSPSASLPATDARSSAIARARVAIEDADFAGAELALDEAVHAGLGPADLLEWLEVSAMLAFADGRLGAMEDFLLGWASIAPAETAVPTSLPGALRRRLEELRNEARVRLSAEPIQSIEGASRRIAVPVQVQSDPGHLVRDVEVQVRVGDAPFEALDQGATAEVVGSLEAPAQVRYFLVARGPGGAVVATLGSEASPVETLLHGLPPSTEGLTIGLVVTGAIVLVGAVSLVAWGVVEDWGRGDTSALHGPSVALRF